MDDQRGNFDVNVTHSLIQGDMIDQSSGKEPGSVSTGDTWTVVVVDL
jgi:hypothetical protein